MNTYKITIYIVVINLICSFVSVPALASQLLEKQQKHRAANIENSTLSAPDDHSTGHPWIENKQPNTKAHEALDFIANSSRHGLNPSDYHYDVLQHTDTATGKFDAHRFERLLTEGILKLIHDIAVGRLNPAVVDPKWVIPRMHFDAAKFLQLALQADSFKACLDALIPASDEYYQLTAALRRYQEYIDRGDWPKAPESPVLRIGDTHQNIPVIRKRLAFENAALDSTTSNHFDDNLEQVVKQFQRRYSLKDDGIIGPETRRAMNVSATERLQQIKVNMERIRWLPDDLGKRYIMVNLANYRLNAIEDDETKLDMRVIVGKKQRPTPSFTSRITRVVVNPHWYVPARLARLDLLPRQQANPDYFDNYNFRIYENKNGKRIEVDPDSIDWHSLSKNHFPYSLVQEPGKDNALGQLKFIAPNPWSIYLHDTPAKSLFDKTSRNFSSGCIRVEDPLALANFSLAGMNRRYELLDYIDKNKSYSTKLEQPVSVYAIYSTVWCNGNELIFSPDSYNRDKRMTDYL